MRGAPHRPGSLEERHDLGRRLLGDTEVAGQLDRRHVVAADEVAGREAVHRRSSAIRRPSASLAGPASTMRLGRPDHAGSPAPRGSSGVRDGPDGCGHAPSIVRHPYYPTVSACPFVRPPGGLPPCRCAPSPASATAVAGSSSVLVARGAHRHQRARRRSLGTNFTHQLQRAEHRVDARVEPPRRQLQGAVGRHRAGRDAGLAVDARRRGRGAGEAFITAFGQVPHVAERERSVHDAGRHLEVGNRRARQRAARRQSRRTSRTPSASR